MTWAHKKKLTRNKAFVELDHELRLLYSAFTYGSFMEERLSTIKCKEEKRFFKIVTGKEQELRMKNRAMFIAFEDKNKNFFHSFTRHRKSYNSIWELKDESGNVVIGFQVLIYHRVNYFSSLLKNLNI